MTDARQSSLAHRMQRTDPGQRLPGPVPRQILILIDQNQPQSLAAELARTYRLQRIRSERLSLLEARAELMRVRQGHSQEAVLAALQRDSRVRSAQLNQRYLRGAGDVPISLELAEADRLREPGDQRNLQPSIPQYAVRKLDLPDAHQLALGRNVAIAVIDSAIDARHPDLRGAVARSFDAGGRPDAAPDYHGTAVAGIIRARGLVQGAAPGAEILAIRAFRANGETDGPTTTTHILISAVDWAVRNGARVLNMSFIGAHDPALQQILSVANGKGVTVVAAAGNGGPTAPPVYPAAYPDVIAVTAVDERDQRYQHANRGSYIALAAPGVDILAPVERGGYAYVSGTSFAAAYVSAIAALLLERDPSLDSKSILDLLATGAEDLGSAGRDDDFGAGRVNAYSSLKLLANQLSAKRSDWAHP
jgi:subtilisin family serine protease